MKLGDQSPGVDVILVSWVLWAFCWNNTCLYVYIYIYNRYTIVYIHRNYTYLYIKIIQAIGVKMCRYYTYIGIIYIYIGILHLDVLLYMQDGMCEIHHTGFNVVLNQQSRRFPYNYILQVHMVTTNKCAAYLQSYPRTCLLASMLHRVICQLTLTAMTIDR